MHVFPPSPTLAYAFLAYHEKKWLERFPLEYQPFYYRRHVDGIFVSFNSQEHLELFQSYFNTHHVNISFTIENEKDNSPFLT